MGMVLLCLGLFAGPSQAANHRAALDTAMTPLLQSEHLGRRASERGR
jgi:hypothetical protein